MDSHPSQPQKNCVILSPLQFESYDSCSPSTSVVPSQSTAQNIQAMVQTLCNRIRGEFKKNGGEVGLKIVNDGEEELLGALGAFAEEVDVEGAVQRRKRTGMMTIGWSEDAMKLNDVVERERKEKLENELVALRRNYATKVEAHRSKYVKRFDDLRQEYDKRTVELKSEFEQAVAARIKKELKEKSGHLD